MTSGDVETGIPSARTRVNAAFDLMETLDRPEVWISVAEYAELYDRARDVDNRVAAGESLPLAGVLVAVKDNIDVAGMATTAGCREYSRIPSTSATAVSRLVLAGALVLGKSNMDQFATGLVGTRSPFGAVRHATRPDLIAGGSSSGSAVAVAQGVVDLGLGTDTAGSGRVPAALHGIVGIKPTLGVIPCTGVVPASRLFDTPSVFARDLALASLAVRVMAGSDSLDPRTRPWPGDIRRGIGDAPRVAIAQASCLGALSPAYRARYEAFCESLHGDGCSVVEVDVSVFLDVARLLYDGALVAERYAAVGKFLESEPASADPTVASIILAARDRPAFAFSDDLGRVDSAKRQAIELLAGVDALILPTTTEHPSLVEVDAAPVAINRRLGTYTNFVNLLDLSAIAIPAGNADGLPFGVSVITGAFADQVGLDLAARIGAGQSWATAPQEIAADSGIALAVFGAHMRGQPLNHELSTLGARFIEDITTAALYRMVVVDTKPLKPGLARVGPAEGTWIRGELWRISPSQLSSFLVALPDPMTLGRLELADGRLVVGFGCTAESMSGAVDISHHHSWQNFLHSNQVGLKYGSIND